MARGEIARDVAVTRLWSYKQPWAAAISLLYNVRRFGRESQMREILKIAPVVVTGVLGCVVLCAQSPHTVWVCDTFNGSDCHMVDSSVMGGVRFEDYKVPNPT